MSILAKGDHFTTNNFPSNWNQLCRLVFVVFDANNCGIKKTVTPLQSKKLVTEFHSASKTEFTLGFYPHFQGSVITGIRNRAARSEKYLYTSSFLRLTSCHSSGCSFQKFAIRAWKAKSFRRDAVLFRCRVAAAAAAAAAAAVPFETRCD